MADRRVVQELLDALLQSGKQAFAAENIRQALPATLCNL